METLEKQLDILKRGVIDAFPEGELEKKLKKAIETGTPLRVKYGIDPTAPDIHLGFTVGLRKLRQFQDLGHQAVLLIGNYTAMVGDPSGRNTTRPRLSQEEVMANAETYLDQAGKIIDRDKLEIVYNGDWFGKMNFSEVMGLASRMTVARMIEREDFKNRIKEGNPVSLHEFFYPIMQGYDSVAMKADVELGGTDQRFNILVGRDFQAAEGMEQQMALMVPLLPGLDGQKKMSKSLGNYIGVQENAKDMFGKMMSIPDELMKTYYELLTDRDMEQTRSDLAGGKHPMDMKKQLAIDIVSGYHSPEAAQKELNEFESVFSKGNLPDDMKEIVIPEATLWVVDLVDRTGHLKSKGEIRRLIKQGGLSLDNEKVTDEQAQIEIKDEIILKAGKRGYYRIVKG